MNGAFSRNDFTAFVGTKEELKALENEASDLEKVREQREVCKAESVSSSTSNAFANSVTFVFTDSDSVSSLVTSFDFL